MEYGFSQIVSSVVFLSFFSSVLSEYYASVFGLFISVESLTPMHIVQISIRVFTLQIYI